MKQPQVYICPLLLETASPSHFSRCHKALTLGSLCHTNSHRLSILHMIMYKFQCYFLNLSHALLPPLCPQICSLYLHLYSCPANRFISTIFLDSMYMLWVHPPQFNQHIHSFLWLSNTQLCICTTNSLSIHLLMDI